MYVNTNFKLFGVQKILSKKKAYNQLLVLHRNRFSLLTFDKVVIFLRKHTICSRISHILIKNKKVNFKKVTILAY